MAVTRAAALQLPALSRLGSKPSPRGPQTLRAASEGECGRIQCRLPLGRPIMQQRKGMKDRHMPQCGSSDSTRLEERSQMWKAARRGTPSVGSVQNRHVRRDRGQIHGCRGPGDGRDGERRPNRFGVLLSGPSRDTEPAGSQSGVYSGLPRSRSHDLRSVSRLPRKAGGAITARRPRDEEQRPPGWDTRASPLSGRRGVHLSGEGFFPQPPTRGLGPPAAPHGRTQRRSLPGPWGILWSDT